MGIKGLPAFLKRHVPEAFKALKGAAGVVAAIKAATPPGAVPRVAVDVPSLFYRIMYSAEDVQQGCMAFLELFAPLRAAGIGVLFVFDGPHKPNKQHEHARRNERRNTDTKNLAIIKQGIEEHQSMPLPDDMEPGAWLTQFFQQQAQAEKIEKRLDVMQPGDYTTLAQFLTANNFLTLIAHDEGEGAAVWLCKQGMAHAVISEDFDVLALGGRCFIRNYGRHDDVKYPCQAVYLDTVLPALKMTHDMFIQFCVLCGSDFTHHLHNMGPVKALKTMQLYKDIPTYLASQSFKTEYGQVGYDPAAALQQFRHPRPPYVTKSWALCMWILLVLIGKCLRCRKRQRQN